MKHRAGGRKLLEGVVETTATFDQSIECNALMGFLFHYITDMQINRLI